MKRGRTILNKVLRKQEQFSGWIEWTDSRGKPVKVPWKVLTGISLVLVLVIGIFDLFHLRPRYIPEMKVWNRALVEGERSGLEPAFIYAVCVAESSLNANARAGRARGLMQMTPEAWKEVNAGSFGKAFSWRRNMRAGVDYLVFCRGLLPENLQDSYPHIAASYRYGPYRVRATGGDLNQLPQPKNRIYKELFRGNLQADLIPEP
jgi:hypothetical protein